MKYSQMLLLKIMFVLASCAARAEACEFDEIETAVNDNNYQSAYSLAVECESSSDITGAELFQLAFFYLLPDIEDFQTDEAKTAKFYELLTRSSLMGERDSIQLLLGGIHGGDDFLVIEPDAAKADCLQRLVDGPGAIPPEAVKQCLGGDEILKLLMPNYVP